MRITPLDIRKQEFRKAMRGLDPEEVYAFLATVGDEYEAVLNENKALRERLLELDDKVAEYRTMERTLRDTLVTAERVTGEAKDNARREADIIIKEAHIESEKALRNIKNEAMTLRQEVAQLRSERDGYLAKMKVVAESHLKFIESAEKDLSEENASLADRVGEIESPKPKPQADAIAGLGGTGAANDLFTGNPGRSQSYSPESAPTEQPYRGTSPSPSDPPEGPRASDSVGEIRAGQPNETHVAPPSPSMEHAIDAANAQARPDAPIVGRVDVSVPPQSQEAHESSVATATRPAAPEPGGESSHLQPELLSGDYSESALSNIQEIIDRMAGSSRPDGAPGDRPSPTPPPAPAPASEPTVLNSSDPARDTRRLDETSEWSMDQIKKDILSNLADDEHSR